MKALKSKLAHTVLADPRAKEKLRNFLAARSMSQGHKVEPDVTIEVFVEGKRATLTPVVVPKAG